MIGQEHKKYSTKCDQPPKYRITIQEGKKIIKKRCEVCTAYVTWLLDITDTKYSVEKL